MTDQAKWQAADSVFMVLVDFDGTVVDHCFPEIGPPLPGAIECLLDLQAAGAKIILHTCREDQDERAYLTEAVEFLRNCGVDPVGVNETPLEYDFRPEHNQRRKPYAHVHIDDRNLGGFPGWNIVRELLLDSERLPKP